MNRRLKRIWKIFVNLPRRGKIGIALWLIGYPIGLTGMILFLGGNHFLGTVFMIVPYIEGNFGMLLAGKSVISSIRKEFFKKSES
jgi:hypothetical protein